MEKHLRPALHPYAKLCLGLIALFVIAGSIISSLYPDYNLPALVMAAVLSILSLLKLSHYAYLHYFTEYVVDDSEIKSVYGIWAKDENHVPIEKIEDYNIDRSIIGKLLGLASIGVQTARGERGYEVMLLSLPEKEVEALDQMLDKLTRMKAK
ncbi:MAG: PH domain-containing protein [Candidatus Micrarchaeia archaeon]